MKRIIVFLTLSATLFSLSAQKGWNYQTPANLIKITFNDNTSLIDVGSVIWKSDDFGGSWKGATPGYKYRDASTNHFLNGVDFFCNLK